jgi:sugar lactone lactonase YvrE
MLALALHGQGGLLVAYGNSIRRWSPQTGLTSELIVIEADYPDNRVNCMTCDPLGNLWVATMQNNVDAAGQPKATTGSTGALYRVDPAGRLQQLDEAYGCPNTMLFSPDLKCFYMADSVTGWIYQYAFNVRTGKLGQKAEFFSAPDQGVPDGSAIDNEGCLWNARWGANCVLQISPSGELVGKIEILAHQPTCCVFGGEERKTLFITSARFGMNKALLTADDGALFAIQLDIGGAVIYNFSSSLQAAE